MDVVIIGSDDVQRYERVLQKRIRRGGEHPRDLCRFMLIQIGGPGHTLLQYVTSADMRRILPPIESLRHLTIDFGISHPSDLVEFLASLKSARHLVSLDIRCGTVDHMKAPLLEFSMDVIAQAQSDHIDRNTFGNLKSLAVDCGHEQMVLDIMLRAQNIQHIRISTAFGILPFIPHTLPNFRTLCLQLRNGKKNYGNWNLSFAFGQGLLSPQEDTPKMLYMEGSEELTARWRGDIREVKKLCEHHDVPVIWRKRFEPPKYKEVSQVGAST
ncbi:hypothetical protein SISNIDRAFT_450603 [Sistotremastrum niveocremeum HHB9708]|uniref:Uncharacterized protein n=1 Tax=Sistotremastrum niveocremeum HHB9708 TaxID=1314777 RepID=A0A164YFB9_9AGAM|nr:hypothetical protein SISNIDRAFT_450603 [Sistotremastrum niveocremeum HHB9708]